MKTSKKPQRFVDNYSTGTILFRINDQNIDSQEHKYLYVPWNVNPKRLEVTKKNWWGEQQPSIIVAIASDNKYLSSWTSEREIKDFKTGLMKAAKSTHMVIVTNGVNFGASKVVGDAVNYAINKSRILQPDKKDEEEGATFKLNVVGISARSRLSYDNIFKDELVYLNVSTPTPEQIENRKYKLNPHLTHYVIVKEEPNSKFGINTFTSSFLQTLSKPLTDTEKTTPIVFLVIQGSGGCANLVKEHLKLKFPVIVFKGSGGFSDLLAFAFEEMEQRYKDLGIDWDREFIEDSLKPELKVKILRSFPKIKDKETKMQEFRDNIIECVRLARQDNCVFITVLAVNNSMCNLENLSEYFLKAILKSQRAENGLLSQETYEKDLKLSIDWNCVEIAKNDVLLKNNRLINDGSTIKSIFKTLLYQPHREEFVDLFLSQNFKVHKFLTPTKLRNLYKLILRKDFFRGNCWERMLGHSPDTKLSKDFIDRELNWLIEECTGLKKFVRSEEFYANIIAMYLVNEAAAERKALAILAIWAIFANRKKLVKVLWKHCDNPIHLGLIISTIYGRLSLYVTEEIVMEELRKEARVFTSYATGVLDECYQQSAAKATDVLKEESPVWNYKTAVDFAANSKFTKFFAHPCCQKWLTNTFNGRIRIRELSWGLFTIPVALKVLLCALFIFPMYIWVRFELTDYKGALKKDEETNTNELEEDKENQMRMDKAREAAQMRARDSGVPWVKEKDWRVRWSKKVQMLMREFILQKQPPILTMIYLMWTSPITKFWTSQFFYIFYLSLFSVAVLYPSCGVWGLDFVISSWTFCHLIESIHRTFIFAKKFTFVPVIYKWIEIVGMIIFIIFYITTRVIQIPLLKPYSTKVVLCFGLLYCYYRIFTIYLPIAPALGPLLYRLKLMITIDFVNFWKMAILVLVSSGIVIQAVLYPDGELDTYELVRATFHRAFFTFFVTPVDELSPKDDCYNFTLTEEDKVMIGDQCLYTGGYKETRCPNPGFWPWVFHIQYFIFLKLILLTLLYALFASTASRLEDESDSIWKFQRYVLVTDFANRLSLPAPLSIIAYGIKLYHFVKKAVIYVYKKGWKSKEPRAGIFAEQKKNIKSDDKYNFWLTLAKQYYEKEEQKEAKDKNLLNKEWECLQRISEEVEYEKKTLRQVQTKVNELEKAVDDMIKIVQSIKKKK